MKKLDTRTFIEKAKKKHGDIYDYSQVYYTNSTKKVKIICSKHGIFEQLPSTHITKQGKGCRKCVYDSYKDTIQKFILKANKIHNHKYDYSLLTETTEFNRHNYINIICPNHGIFSQRNDSHLSGYGCKKCTQEYKLYLSMKKFIDKSKLIHKNVYDYSLVHYKGKDNKIEILCPIHGNFKQTPHNHLKGKGCLYCKESKGEKEIRNFLLENKIKFTAEKRFPECKHKYTLPFDFYLPDYNICVEFNGFQHYKPVNYWGGDKGFELIKLRDEIKINYCKNNNITLIIIKENENIKKILNNKLF